MSRPAKGPRLYLRNSRVKAGGQRLAPIYFIRDGAQEFGTGCGPERLPDAEKALADYIAAKHAVPVVPADRRRDPSQVLISEVLTLYAVERAPELDSDGVTVAGFITKLLEFWGDKSLDDVRRSNCRAYAAWRTAQTVKIGGRPSTRKVSSQTARRELEILSSATGYWNGEDKLIARPEVWLPAKPESPRDALTRSQAAALLLAAMGWRKQPDGRWKRLQGSSRANRAHLRRFILIALYTGSRSAVITSLLWRESATNAWVDLERGMIYRRGKAERDRANKRRPVVKLPPRLLAHLRRWRRLDAAQEQRATERGLNTPLNMVVHHGGEPVAKVKKGFAGCVKDAGLPAGVTAHWLRHTAATLLMEAGVDIWLASSYLGMSALTLEKHYAHHRPDFQDQARRGLSRSR